LARGKSRLVAQIDLDLLANGPMHHELLTKLLQEYLFVGGMPAAIAEFINSKNPNRVRAVQRSIVRTYQDDFPKYSRKGQFVHIQRIFERVPSYIGKKIKFSEFMGELQSRDIRASLRLCKKHE
jgi:predicted AAA+ superfamily ATPase